MPEITFYHKLTFTFLGISSLIGWNAGNISNKEKDKYQYNIDLIIDIFMKFK